jgi:NAD(P)-dependent dehydrogenase (short-subunit alcohol dehydrogenase family)
MADQNISAGPTATGTRLQRVVIITGASQGIGAALVGAYRKLNYSVVANSRTITAADDPGVAAVAGDIADPATTESLVATAVERFGRVDTLINNAGVFVAKPFTEYTAADYRHVTAVNLTGFFHITQRVIAQMLSQGDGGHVVNVTTTLVEHADARVPSAGLPDQGRLGGCHQIVGNRIRAQWNSGQCDIARGHRYPDACQQ